MSRFTLRGRPLTPFTFTLLVGSQKIASMIICKIRVRNRGKSIKECRTYPNGRLINKYKTAGYVQMNYWSMPDDTVLHTQGCKSSNGRKGRLICVIFYGSDRQASILMEHRVDGPAMMRTYRGGDDNGYEMTYYWMGDYWKERRSEYIMFADQFNSRDIFGRPCQHDLSLPAEIDRGRSIEWDIYVNGVEDYIEYRRDGPSTIKAAKVPDSEEDESDS